jgi:CubicO group peptidase (beta-lactamase class C family)
LVHPKLAPGLPGTSLYSDLGYRLLAELLEAELGEPFPVLGARASGLVSAPWPEPPPFVPQGLDLELWALAEPDLTFPCRDAHAPNDANARAGMRGHAGFGADPEAFRLCLERWVASGAPDRMARDVARGADGARWGLGLQRAFRGPGRFGELLDTLPCGGGVHVLVDETEALESEAPGAGLPPGDPSAFWYHLGYTGPAIFYRPEDRLCIGLLAHRGGPDGELLDAGRLQARRMGMLERWART